jgi:hypothetical protein
MEDTVSETCEHQVPQFWAVQYLCFPEGELRDEARRVTALNFCTHAETGLGSGWEKQFEAVLAKLKGESVNNVSTLTKNSPRLAIVPNDDATG